MGQIVAGCGAVLIVLGIAMPWIATNLVHDPAPRAQSEVDAAALTIFGATFAAGIKMSAYGYVVNVTNLTDFEFVPDIVQTDLAVLAMDGVDALVIFENKINPAPGELVVAEGFAYSFEFNNTTYPIVIGASVGHFAWAALSGDVSAVLEPARVFRPWWDAAGVELAAAGGGVVATAALLELWRRRSPARHLPEPPPAAAPPPPPPR